MEILLEICGWIGTVLVIVAYFLVSFNKMNPKSSVYQWMNLVGSVAIGINVFHRQAWPAVALEIVWGMIAIAALMKR